MVSLMKPGRLIDGVRIHQLQVSSAVLLRKQNIYQGQSCGYAKLQMRLPSSGRQEHVSYQNGSTRIDLEASTKERSDMLTTKACHNSHLDGGYVQQESDSA